MLKLYDEEMGKVKVQQLPAEGAIQMKDKSEALKDPKKTTLFRSAFWPIHQQQRVSTA